MSKKNYERAVVALMEHPTAKEAARAAGIGVSTLRSYKSDPEFMELYTAARHELLDAGVRSMQERFSDAVDTVCEIMSDRTASHSVRLSAANSIISGCVQLTDKVEDMERTSQSRMLNRELFGGFSDFFPTK